ncbi:MAG: STAS domain-containing protein [Gemmatimonadetes bacterium]|nr:STAS domain-containing protein [Gemmatimonadota bacterium]
MNDFTASIDREEGVAVINLAGYLSSEVAAPLEEAFGQIGDADKILLAFQEKDFINSAGLAVMFDLILPLKDQGKQFRIAHPAAHFRKVFDIVGMSKDADVFPSAEEARTNW